MTLEQSLLDGWYYSIEVAPGVWSRGMNFQSVSLARTLLARVDVTGWNCLDVGCEEGLISRLMARRGGIVDAWDRMCMTDRLFMGPSQHVLFVGPTVGQRATLREFSRHCQQYDVAIYSGVLYHVLDPLGSLLHARQTLRNGGMMIVETAARNVPGMAMHFNDCGRFYERPEQGNYWFPTVELLAYLLQLCRLKLLDVVWYPQHGDLVRVAFACRAVDHVRCMDAWALAHQEQVGEIAANFAEFIDWNRCRSDQKPVRYTHTRSEGPLGRLLPLGSSDVLAPEDRQRLSVLRWEDTE
jgi:SAM-dependent methyltransferase